MGGRFGAGSAPGLHSRYRGGRGGTSGGLG
jgi:hypothetical protein